MGTEWSIYIVLLWLSPECKKLVNGLGRLGLVDDVRRDEALVTFRI